MLEKPEVDDQIITETILREYGLKIDSFAFLPLGADINTAVYRAKAKNFDTFVKLRRGNFQAAAVTVPHYLNALGLAATIPPRATLSGKLWAELPPYKVILFPFINGANGFEIDLTDQQRIELGSSLRKLHTTRLPDEISLSVPRETFSPRWRQQVAALVERRGQFDQSDPILRELSALLTQEHDIIIDLIERTSRLAENLRHHPLEAVMCHGDIHGWNMLIGEDQKLYIVDWDTLGLAPKERDLMFVGCGLGGRGHVPAEEERLFYEGYGATSINQAALAYYRYERIIEDIAAYGVQLFNSTGSGPDRVEGLANLQSNFEPGGTIDLAGKIDKSEVN